MSQNNNTSVSEGGGPCTSTSASDAKEDLERLLSLVNWMDHGSVKVALRLLSPVAALSTDLEGNMVLHRLAGALAEEKEVRLHIRAGADPVARNRKGETPLHVALSALPEGKKDSDRLGVVNALVEGGSDCCATGGERGMSPIHLVVARNYRHATMMAGTMIATLATGALPQNNRLDTPLHIAAWRCSAALASMLLPFSDVDSLNARGESPLLTAISTVRRHILMGGASLLLGGPQGRLCGWFDGAGLPRVGMAEMGCGWDDPADSVWDELNENWMIDGEESEEGSEFWDDSSWFG